MKSDSTERNSFMHVKNIVTATIATTALAVVTAASAAAYPNADKYGTQLQLNDLGGTVVTGWTINDLHPSSDTVPVPVSGTLWEATATVDAVRGPVTPVISDFNARTSTGTTYRALAQAATPQGVNPAPLQPGASETGKIYFDVNGPTPDSVVYNNGAQDLLIWK
jgi:Domain of unknown function (DUF1942)